jgi:two-component system NtrC family sensor kinase
MNTIVTGTPPSFMDMPDLCRAIAESSIDPVAAVDGAAHIIRYVNAAFSVLAGKHKEELIGSAFSSVLLTDDDCLSMLNRVFRSGNAETHIGQNTSTEHPFFWSYAMSTILAPNDNSIGIFIRIFETTPEHRDSIAMNQALLIGALRHHELAAEAERLNDQVQIEILATTKAHEALVQSEKLASVGRMAAVIAHEINNPLDVMMNTLYLAQTIEGLPDAARKYIEIADGELKRIAHITRQTLGFYRESTHPTTFFVAPLLESVLDLLQSRIRSKCAMVERRCDKNLQITAISGELRQVLANLVLNSLDAIDENGSVRLDVHMSASSTLGHIVPQIRITVADDGPGIDEATLPHIFEPFFTTKGSIGNGLGLWVSRQIIGKHGGLIRVRSRTTGPRKGTIFTIVLPVEAVSLVPPPTPGTHPAHRLTQTL